MRIIWLGHSGFRIEVEQAVLLVDPWLTGNPMFPAERRAEAITGATHVLLTHGHGDHTGDAWAIAAELGIPLVGIYDLVAAHPARAGVDNIGFNKGGTVDLNGAMVTMVNASHSSTREIDGKPVPVGSEAGFMIAGDGHVAYVSGDTDIMADMGWMAEYHQPDVGILSAGGHFTMDMKRAAWAANRFFNFRTIIPCHYRTFPLLEQNADALRAGVAPGVQVIEPEVLEAINI